MPNDNSVFNKAFFKEKKSCSLARQVILHFGPCFILFSRRNVERTQFVHNGYWSTDKKKDSPPPKGITITKGSIHITVSRAFVEYLFNDPLAKGTNY